MHIKCVEPMFLPFVSAFIAENQITQLTVEEKSNEITAVPELLDLIDIDGAIITAEAMSCQKKIVCKKNQDNINYKTKKISQ